MKIWNHIYVATVDNYCSKCSNKIVYIGDEYGPNEPINRPLDQASKKDCHMQLESMDLIGP